MPQVTHLFRDVLHGWGRVLLSVNVSPCACDYDETSHVLKVRHHSLHMKRFSSQHHTALAEHPKTPALLPH